MNTRGPLDFPVVNTLGSLVSAVVNTPGSLYSPVMNTPLHRGVHFLVYLEQALEEVYKKTFWYKYTRSEDSLMC
jgi:hypothetical protein